MKTIKIICISFLIPIVFTLCFISVEKWFGVHIEANNILLVFVGILATFIVIGNYMQVAEIKEEFREKILKLSDLEKTANEVRREIQESENRICELRKDFESVYEDAIDEQRYREKVNERMKLYIEECKANESHDQKFRFILKDANGPDTDYICKYLPENIQEFMNAKYTSRNPSAMSPLSRSCRVRPILEDADFMRNLLLEKGNYGSIECEIQFLNENEPAPELIFMGSINFENITGVEDYIELGLTHIWASSSLARDMFGGNKNMKNLIDFIIEEKIQWAMEKDKKMQGRKDYIERKLHRS
jgi:hypothetical protein